jgi:hypothetical protein
MIDEALAAEKTAMDVEPANDPFYRRQMTFFRNNSWPADLEAWIKEK